MTLASCPAGLYVCQYIIMSTWHQLQQRVVVAPSPADLAQTPAQVSMNCSSAAGLALQCCIRNTGQAYSVAWSPGPAQPGVCCMQGLGGGPGELPGCIGAEVPRGCSLAACSAFRPRVVCLQGFTPDNLFLLTHSSGGR